MNFSDILIILSTFILSHFALFPPQQVGLIQKCFIIMCNKILHIYLYQNLKNIQSVWEYKASGM